MSQYGKDIKLNSYGDISFTSDGDVETVTDGDLVAQDVATEAKLSPGSCFWAPQFGRGLRDSLKKPADSDRFIENALREAAFNDERIDFDSVESRRVEEGHYKLSFTLIGSVDPVELYFDLQEEINDLAE